MHEAADGVPAPAPAWHGCAHVSSPGINPNAYSVTSSRRLAWSMAMFLEVDMFLELLDLRRSCIALVAHAHYANRKRELSVM